ncbi:hypothetical protein HMI54_010518 [Coelomomyces lativittatus]|nr:hypothetical protein HMI55_000067 [Coelomomyces lativittatus]KAJ1514785.1 hypothetical protein HMI56_007421 [Coelomomyces lativittatus]KAJ1516177.1 hypothetical protein HMI54_010518 [Coelomomyces lativittatus]
MSTTATLFPTFTLTSTMIILTTPPPPQPPFRPPPFLPNLTLTTQSVPTTPFLTTSIPTPPSPSLHRNPTPPTTSSSLDPLRLTSSSWTPFQITLISLLGILSACLLISVILFLRCKRGRGGTCSIFGGCSKRRPRRTKPRGGPYTSRALSFHPSSLSMEGEDEVEDDPNPHGRGGGVPWNTHPPHFWCAFHTRQPPSTLPLASSTSASSSSSSNHYLPPSSPGRLGHSHGLVWAASPRHPETNEAVG